MTSAFRNRVCTRCSASQMTRSKAEVCLLCTNAIRQERLAEEEQEMLEGLYINVTGPVVDKYKHRTWTFVHPECGTKQTWVYGNILKRLKEDPKSVPCSYCGGRRRSKNATAVSAENRKIKNPEGWPDYLYVVRRMTDEIYLLHKDQINPLNIVRSREYHLDHIMSIAEGYESGHPPEFIARKENLQMLKSFDNLSKGRK